jgi:hypothetical protein
VTTEQECSEPVDEVAAVLAAIDDVAAMHLRDEHYGDDVAARNWRLAGLSIELAQAVRRERAK